MTWLLVVIAGFLGGLVQGLTGFGAVIIMMIFLPNILPIDQSAGVAGLMMLGSVLTLVYRNRHEIQLKRIIIPFLVYASVASWSVHLGHVLDVHLLRMMLGGLLVALSLYFSFNKNSGSTAYPWYIAGMFMIISGFFNGLFGIGGPLMALYFLSKARSLPQYLADLQTFFLIDTFYITTLRVASGIVTVHLVPFIIIGMLGAITGTTIAAHLLTHLKVDVMKRIIYVFIGLSGLYYLFV
ncbi:sulfite exporter TauE/SafE family protein [Levilactobacillus angrenensis]|uniref:Probable membrane transporter protein n=1 Tax=Levilactobacillus angrenensis TaxID=2486020 RepID=A0ABW1U762_9LACO|nr:sulfite exporter TauE/SafE family protein [Levilactobacillus angrenensis]